MSESRMSFQSLGHSQELLNSLDLMDDDAELLDPTGRDKIRSKINALFSGEPITVDDEGYIKVTYEALPSLYTRIADREKKRMFLQSYLNEFDTVTSKVSWTLTLLPKATGNPEAQQKLLGELRRAVPDLEMTVKNFDSLIEVVQADVEAADVDQDFKNVMGLLLELRRKSSQSLAEAHTFLNQQ